MPGNGAPAFLAAGAGFLGDRLSTDPAGGEEGMVWGRSKHITLIVHFIILTL